MPVARLEPVVRFIRQSVHHDQPTDTELLTRFTACRDEAAFSALVHRHGRLVLGVCRRALRDVHAAEDAFQATFLLLARKAGSLACPERLSNWLHGVACRVAARARAREARRRTCEGNAPVPAATLPDQGPDWRDVRLVLDEEVNRLPARQRDAVVLCYLEGRTNAEAAHLLGCPRGSVATLLSRARERLGQRLARRGLAPPAALVGTWLAQQAEATALPASLAHATVTAAVQCSEGGLRAAALVSGPAAALAKGVVRTMFLNKLKLSVAIFFILAALAGTGASLMGRAAAPGPLPVRQPVGSQGLTLSEALRRSLKHAGFQVREKGAAWRISLPGSDSPEAERIAAQRILNTESAYWNLYGGYWTLYTREQGLRLAHEAFRLSRSRYEAGKITAGDFHQARGQCELFRAQRLQAISQLAEFERQLRSLLGMDAGDDTRLVPSDSPKLAAHRPDLNTALLEALNKRPELCMTRREIKGAQMNVLLATNQLLPDLRFTATYDDHSDRPDALGLVVPNGFRLAAVQVRQAELKLARARETLKDQETKTARFLGQEYERIRVAYEQIRANRAQREAFREQLRVRNEEYKAGRGKPDTLLEARRFWADALNSEYAAIVTYNNALAGFDFARGAALEQHRISLEETGAQREAKSASSAQRPPRDGKISPKGEMRVDRLLTSRDLMQLLQISQKTFDKLRAAGKLPEPIKLDGTALLRWPREEVLAWIDARCPPAAEWSVIWARQRSRR